MLLLSACGTLRKYDEGGAGAPYHDAAFDDHNRPPKNLTPMPQLQGEKIDPLYMRVQADYNYSMGEAYSFEGDSAKAIEAFKEVLVYDLENPTVRTRLGTELLRVGKITESIEQLELAIIKDPKNLEAHLILGGVMTTLKMYDKAVGHYQKVIHADPDNTDAQMYLGAVYAEQKKYDLAIKQFDALLKNSEFNQTYLLHYYKARVHLEQKGEKNQKAAESDLIKALEVKPDFTEAAFSLGDFYKARNQSEKAIKVFKNFQKENGSNAKIAEMLSTYYLDENKFEQAYEQLEILETHSEYSINAKLKMSLILIQRHDYRIAAKKLNEILLEVPDSDKVRFYLGAVHEELKEPELAIKNYSAVGFASPLFSESIVHAAFLLNRTNKSEEALKLLEGALDKAPDQFNIYAMYASILDEKAEYKKALAILEKGIVKFPENAQMRFYYGTVQDRIGNKDKVIPEMKKVVELDPKHVQGLNYLAFTLAEQDSNLEEAEGYARRAFSLDPKDGYIMDTLGWVLFKRSQFNEAIRYLEGALKLQPNVSVIAEHLGDAYAKLAMVDKALKMYYRAVELESDKQKAQTIRSKLTSIESQTLNPSRKPASYSPKK